MLPSLRANLTPEESISFVQSSAGGCSVEAATMLMLAFRGHTQAVGSREQLFSSNFLFSALFHINYMILVLFPRKWEYVLEQCGRLAPLA